jgi:hypothetical protein
VVEDYSFPLDAFRERGLRAIDDQARISALRDDLTEIANGRPGGDVLRYIVPWNDSSIPANSADLIFSHAVLQEIPHGSRRSDLRDAFGTIASWLKPGGVATHQVDLSMYGLEPWNIHWTWSWLFWKVVRGRRENFVNREPLSTYLTLAAESGLSIVAVEREDAEGVPCHSLASRFKRLDGRDRSSKSAFLILRKPAVD